MKAFYLISITVILTVALFQQVIRKDLEMAKVNLLWAICIAIIYTAL